MIGTPVAICGAGFLLLIMTLPTGAVFRPPPEPTQSSGVPWHSSLDAVVRCRPGESHSRWPECHCGQYAKIVDQSRIDIDDPDNANIFTKRKGTRTIYYTCLPCSGCPQGVIMIDFCRQKSDTLCDPTLQCENPDNVFDDGRKACIPKETSITVGGNEDEIPSNTDIPIVDVVEPPTTPPHNAPDQNPPDPSAEGQSESKFDIETILIIIGVCFAVLVGVEVLVLIIYIIYRNRQKNSSCPVYRASSVTSDLSQLSQTPQCSCLETAV